MASYTYVVAVDFEATCWEEQLPPEFRDAEIIEFPAILVNLKTGKIESQFHKYVKPVEKPHLSKYCINLTGIQQKIVDAGVPVQTAIDLFIEWLKRELKERDLLLPKMSEAEPLGNCLLSSWTDWDFGICLAKEFERKNMRKPGCFDQWMDAKAIFRQFYNYRPYNFNNALAYLKLNFQGRPHSGIDDAKNLARLLCKMYQDGASLAVTKDLKPFVKLNQNGGF